MAAYQQTRQVEDSGGGPMRIYLTHCSAKKDDKLKDTGIQVTPDRLYTSSRTQRFIEKCRAAGVNWAILSDKHGICFPDETHAWYDKHPGKVTYEELQALVLDFERKLQGYDEIKFYYHPGRFHRTYRSILDSVCLKGRISLFIHLDEIE